MKQGISIQPVQYQQVVSNYPNKFRKQSNYGESEPQNGVIISQRQNSGFIQQPFLSSQNTISTSQNVKMNIQPGIQQQVNNQFTQNYSKLNLNLQQFNYPNISNMNQNQSNYNLSNYSQSLQNHQPQIQKQIISRQIVSQPTIIQQQLVKNDQKDQYLQSRLSQVEAENASLILQIEKAKLKQKEQLDYSLNIKDLQIKNVSLLIELQTLKNKRTGQSYKEDSQCLIDYLILQVEIERLNRILQARDSQITEITRKIEKSFSQRKEMEDQLKNKYVD